MTDQNIFDVVHGRDINSSGGESTLCGYWSGINGDDTDDWKPGDFIRFAQKGESISCVLCKRTIEDVYKNFTKNGVAK